LCNQLNLIHRKLVFEKDKRIYTRKNYTKLNLDTLIKTIELH